MNLVNYSNVASLYIQYSHPNRWWEIRAMYPSASEHILYDILAKFDDKDECDSVFKRIVNEICEQKQDLVVI